MPTQQSVAVNRKSAQVLLISFVFGLVASCKVETKAHREMEFRDSLSFVRNDLIQFVTMQPPGSQFTTLERRVIITGPPELVELSGSGDRRVLEELVGFLKSREKAWAAMVLLAALTGREEKVVDAFATTPGEWWESVGKTAYVQWSEWLTESREKLVWDSENRMFVERR